MKVYLELPSDSRGLRRVYDAFIKYKPQEVEITRDSTKADLTILHVNGRNQTLRKKIDTLRADSRPYVMMQYVLRSTKNPDTRDWIDLWGYAKLVWSYYDLAQLIKEDTDSESVSFDNFYYAPLGVEPEVFKEYPGRRNATITVHSQSYLTESARECIAASLKVGKDAIFITNKKEFLKGAQVYTNVTDKEMSYLYSYAQYVSGLRRIEGFEQPVIEGLLCGARPIVFDRPEMRHWFNEFALFIPELPREETIDYLTGVFRSPGNNVTEAEKALALERFNWSIIMKGFWERVL